MTTSASCRHKRLRPRGIAAGLAAFSLAFAPVSQALAQAPAAEANRILEGKILNDQGQAIEKAVVKVRNLDTGEEFTSAPTGGNGAYKFNRLPSGRYEISVQTERGIYLGNRTVDLVNKQAQTYSFSLKSVPPEEALKEAAKARGDEAAKDDDDEGAGKRPAVLPSEAAKTSLWRNPTTAVLLGLAIAIGTGIVIDEARDEDEDDEDASPSTP